MDAMRLAFATILGILTVSEDGKMQQQLLRQLLAEAAEKQGWRNDEEIGNGLGVSQAMPSMWRRHKRFPNFEHMWKICESAGYPPKWGIVQVMAMQAEGSDLAPALEAWASELRAE